MEPATEELINKTQLVRTKVRDHAGTNHTVQKFARGEFITKEINTKIK